MPRWSQRFEVFKKVPKKRLLFETIYWIKETITKYFYINALQNIHLCAVIYLLIQLNPSKCTISRFRRSYGQIRTEIHTDRHDQIDSASDLDQEYQRFRSTSFSYFGTLYKVH